MHVFVLVDSLSGLYNAGWTHFSCNLSQQHWVAEYYVSLGAPKDKLNIGIALYGRTFLLDNPNQHDVGSPAAQPGDAGLFTSERGFIAYYEVIMFCVVCSLGYW